MPRSTPPAPRGPSGGPEPHTSPDQQATVGRGSAALAEREARGAPTAAAAFVAIARNAIVAVALALLAGAAVVAAVGDRPLDVYALLFGSALSWPDGIGYTLFYATPLLFTGLAVAVAFRAGLFNIGAEGQLYIAALVTAWVGIAGAGLPAWLLAPLCCLAAAAAGGAWGAVPGVLRARFGAHEVITTIMLNFIAVALAGYFTQYHLKQPGDPILETAAIGEHAHLARLGSLLPGLPPRIPVSLAFPLALAACAGVWVFLWRTRWGYALRATGANPEAAAWNGIATGRQLVLAMTLSGALAGLVATGEVLGYRHRYYDGFSAGYGFTGIAVALLGRNHPAGVALAALFFGAMARGGLFVGIFSDHVSRDLVLVLQGLVILFAAAQRLPRGRRAGGAAADATPSAPPPAAVEPAFPASGALAGEAATAGQPDEADGEGTR